MPYRDIIKELIILLGIAVVIAFTTNFFSPNGIALFGDWDTSKGVITARPKDDIVNHELEIEDILTAKRIYDRQDAIFVDARAQEDYEDGHIEGAVLLPVCQFEEFIDEFIEKYPFSKFIVTYCSGRECEDGHDLAQCLIEEGYENIRVFIDGYMGWKEEGYPIAQ